MLFRDAPLGLTTRAFPHSCRSTCGRYCHATEKGLRQGCTEVRAPLPGLLSQLMVMVTGVVWCSEPDVPVTVKVT